MKRASEEDPVDRADERTAVGRHGREREQAHPTQSLDHLMGVKPSLGSMDAEEVPSGLRVAAVEQYLEGFDVGGRLVQPRQQITSQAVGALLASGRGPARKRSGPCSQAVGALYG